MTAIVRITIALLISATTLSARSENYPSRPVELIVAYPAGGAADVIARSVAQRLSEMWKQSVIVDNRGGGATQIAANAVAQSPADGYHLLVTGMETFTISPFLYSKLPYDPNGFLPVSSFGYSNQILVAPASSSLKNIGDMLSEARKENGAMQYGTIGMGGSSHINMVLLESLSGIKLTPVHYRGGAPLLTDLLGGHVPMGFLSTTLVDQYIKDNKLHALGIGAKKRLSEFPNVPTIAETVPGFEAISWFGLFAPKGTPSDIVQTINAGVQRIFSDPVYKSKFLTPNFLEVLPGDPDKFAGYVKAEANKWSKVIVASHLQVE
jgi:tripartite-type tricarboxylate transporter receptor subunit TctC